MFGDPYENMIKTVLSLSIIVGKSNIYSDDSPKIIKTFWDKIASTAVQMI